MLEEILVRLEERWRRPNKSQLPTVEVKGRKYHYEKCDEGNIYSYILHGRNGARYGLIGKENYFIPLNMKSKKVVETIGKFKVTENGLQWVVPVSQEIPNEIDIKNLVESYLGLTEEEKNITANLTKYRKVFENLYKLAVTEDNKELQDVCKKFVKEIDKSLKQDPEEQDKTLKSISTFFDKNKSKIESEYPLARKVFDTPEIKLDKEEDKASEVIKTLGMWAGGAVLAAVFKDNPEVGALLGGLTAVTSKLSEIAFREPKDYENAADLNRDIDSARSTIRDSNDKYLEKVREMPEDLQKRFFESPPTEEQIEEFTKDKGRDLSKEEILAVSLFNLRFNTYNAITEVATILYKGKRGRINQRMLEKSTGMRTELINQWKDFIGKDPSSLEKQILNAL